MLQFCDFCTIFLLSFVCFVISLVAVSSYEFFVLISMLSRLFGYSNSVHEIVGVSLSLKIEETYMSEPK